MSTNSIPENQKNDKDNLEIVQGTGELLSDRDEAGRERPWQKHKVENQKIVELFKKAKLIDETLISDNRLADFADCGSFLLFLRDAAQKIKLAQANFCRHRLCPMCCWRKSLKLFGQVSQIANELLEQQPTSRFIFVTLTVPNCTADELTTTINDMNKAFAYLTNNNRNFAPAKKFKENLLGYMKAIEITYNQRTDTYHPHIHCLFAVKASYFKGGGYIKKSEWQSIWSKAMQSDRELIVHVEAIKNSTAKAIAEIAKYPVKSADLLSVENEDLAVKALIVLHKSLRNRRLVTFGGVLAEIKKQLQLEDIESENADLIHADEKEDGFVAIEKVLFKWRVKVGAYIC